MSILMPIRFIFFADIYQDQVNLTGGMHVRFPRATLGGAVCVPVVAPRPWNVEAVANFTLWF
ncbi:MAG TPA: hypothetical protein VLT84_03730 [Acidobacteriota bacterium]|nr:hypothetical protein [Acidobacteriota bacterium]